MTGNFRIVKCFTVGLGLLLIGCSSTSFKHPRNAPKPEVSEEAVIDLLGMKVVSSGLPKVRHKQRTLEITAVQENGPAFFAMLQPGDRITRVGGLWPTDARTFAGTLSRKVKSGKVVGVEYAYVAEDGNLRGPNRVEIFPQPSQGGRWITTRIRHKAEQSQFKREKLPGVEEARTVAALQLSELQAQVQRDISANPCAIDGRAAVQMAQQLKLNAHRAGVDLRGGDNDYKLFHLARKACANVSQGTLPEFEATLIGMISNKINACDYSPSANHQAALAQLSLFAPQNHYFSLIFDTGSAVSR